MESPLKPSEKELNHIFLYRKKTVLYRRIPLETKKQLMEEFAKVRNFNYIHNNPPHLFFLKERLSQSH